LWKPPDQAAPQSGEKRKGLSIYNRLPRLEKGAAMLHAALADDRVGAISYF
jgi:hypothetical protein